MNSEQVWLLAQASAQGHSWGRADRLLGEGRGTEVLRGSTLWILDPGVNLFSSLGSSIKQGAEPADLQALQAAGREGQVVVWALEPATPGSRLGPAPYCQHLLGT